MEIIHRLRSDLNIEFKRYREEEHISEDWDVCDDCYGIIAKTGIKEIFINAVKEESENN